MYKSIVSISLLLVSISSANAATLNVDVSGQLLGATGVNVGGTIYDVTFEDTTCALAYSGCNSTNDLTFQSEAAAAEASEALGMQVFVDGVLGQFDSNPSLTNGCISPALCRVLTPFSVSSGTNTLFAATFENHSNPAFDVVGRSGNPIGTDFSNGSDSVLAVWSPNIGAVPVPAAVWLFGTAMIGLVGFNKRRKLG